MIHLKCPSCGAPLDAESRGERIVCGFCRTAFVVPQVQAEERAPRPEGGGCGPVVTLAVVVGMLMISAVGACVGIFAQNEPVRMVVTPGPVATRVDPFAPRPAPPPPPQDRGIAPSALASLTADRGWVLVDANDRIPDWSQVDVQAVLPALVALAKLWADDALIDVIFIAGVRPDGTLDLRERDDFDLDVRFVSPRLLASAEALREVSERKVESRFRLSIERGRIRALTDFDSGMRKVEIPTPLTLGCGQATAMKRWLEAHNAPRRPLYRMHIQPIGARGKPGWRWMLGDFQPGGSFNVPIFDASTCEKQR